MSQRQTQIKTLSLTSIGGVNERSNITELAPAEYTSLEGVFPEFARLQSRLWGKRTLAKYANSIYGIYQMWSPQGYGVGLYQFTDTVDFGYWITPTTKFDLNIPDLPWDGGGMVVDEFGDPYGSNFEYGTNNVCLISFLNGSTDHSVCLDEESGAGTPNDSNGGPAGQGTNCRYVMTPTSINPVPANYMIGTAGVTGPSGIEGPLPYPEPLAVSASKPSTYTPGQGTHGGNLVAKYLAASTKFNLGGGNWAWEQRWTSYNQKVTLNFSSAMVGGVNPLLVTCLRVRNPNGPFEIDEIILPVTFGADGNYAAFEMDPWEYLPGEGKTAEVNGGYELTDFINLHTFTAYHNKRVCS